MSKAKGLYIPLHTSILAEPKILRMCSLLKKTRPDDKDLIRAKVENLWLWMIDHCQDGDLTNYSNTEIAEFCKYRGNPNAWVNALFECGNNNKPGFLERTEDGRVIAHEWESYGGKVVKTREQNNARQRRNYNSKNNGNNNGNNNGVEQNRTEQNRTEQKKNKQKDDEFDSKFSALWEVWPSSRRTTKKEVSKALRSAIKRDDFEMILAGAKAYIASPYVQSRINAKEFQTIKTLPAWLNSNRWQEDQDAWSTPLNAHAPPQKSYNRFEKSKDSEIIFR